MTLAVTQLPKDLLTSAEVSLYLRVFHHAEVRADTIRQWASRQHINTHGKGPRRYSLREVIAYAKDREII